MNKRLFKIYVVFVALFIAIVLCGPEKYVVNSQDYVVSAEMAEWSQNSTQIVYDHLPTFNHYKEAEIIDVYYLKHRGWSRKNQVAQSIVFESSYKDIEKEYFSDVINVASQEIPINIKYKYKMDPNTDQSLLQNDTIIYFSMSITHSPYQTAEFGYDLLNVVYKFHKNEYLISGCFSHTISDCNFTRDEQLSYFSNYLSSVFPNL